MTSIPSQAELKSFGSFGSVGSRGEGQNRDDREDEDDDDNDIFGGTRDRNPFAQHFFFR